MEETNSDNSRNELKLTLLVQFIGVINVVTEPGFMSIDVISVGQGRGRQHRKN